MNADIMGVMLRGFLCAMVLTVVSAYGQVASGNITGTVVDVTDAVWPNTTVTVVSPVSLVTETDPMGKFVITGLVPGAYRLQVQHPGFMTRDLEVSVESGRKLRWAV